MSKIYKQFKLHVEKSKIVAKRCIRPRLRETFRVC